MQAALRQSQISFGPHHDLQLLHLGHKASVTIAQKAERWRERTLPYNQAAAEITSLFRKGPPRDAYMSVNGMHRRRSQANVTYLTALYLDIDFYKAGHTLETAVEAIERRLRALSLPTPYAISSGRGLYLKWPITPFYVGARDKAHQKHVGKWSHCMGLLVKAFEDIGADPACAEPARVLRLVGSINGNNGEPVTLLGSSRRVKLREVYAPLLKVQKTPQRAAAGVSRPYKQRATVTTIRNWFTLAWARMQDMRTIARARGRIHDGEDRWAWVFCFAVEAAHFCRSEASLVHELDVFVEQCIDNRDGKYSNVAERMKGENSVIGRYKVSHDAETGMFLTKGDTRYKLTTAKLIQMLSVTEQEQRDCVAIVGKAEKERRRTEKRRAEGVRPLAEYLEGHNHQQRSKAAERAAVAVEMAKQGMSARAIAKALNVGRQTVCNYLSAAAANEVLF